MRFVLAYIVFTVLLVAFALLIFAVNVWVFGSPFSEELFLKAQVTATSIFVVYIAAQMWENR